MPRSTAYTLLAEFRRLFPGQTDPTVLRRETWDGLRARAKWTLGLVAIAVLCGSAGAQTAAAEGNAAVAWGENTFLELGAGYKSGMEPNPVASEIGVNNIASISSGDSFNLALLADGTVDSWGGNIYGQLGDNSKENIWEKQIDLAPVQPAGLSHVQVVTVNKTTGKVSPLSAVTAVYASGTHSMALIQNGTVGTVDTWGSNEYGQDGKGVLNPESENPKTGEKEKTMARTSPATPEPVEWKEGEQAHKLENVVAISSGPSSGSDYAVVKDPVSGITTVYAWGRDDHEQLGIGTAGEEGEPEPCKSAELGPVKCSTKPRPVIMPASVTSGERHVISVAAGETYAVALLDNGEALAWGTNGAGQLGNETVPTGGLNNRTNVAVPVEGLKAGTETAASAIATGASTTLALVRSGKVMAWGANGSGQAGEEAGQLGEAGSEECGKTPCFKKPHFVAPWTDSQGTHELSGVSAISEGYGYTLVAHEGKVLSFGTSTWGTLGLGSSRKTEACRDEKEIRENNGAAVNHNGNEARCHGPEECVNLTERAVNWRGTYSPTTEYKYGDGVKEGEKLYVSIKENNKNHTPSTSGTFWVEVKEEKGDKVKEVEGTLCARHPYPVEGIGTVASITAGSKHAVALLQSGVAAPPPLVTLTPGREALNLKWRTPPYEAESRVRAGLVNPEKPTSPEYGPTYEKVTFVAEEFSQPFPGVKETEGLKVQPYAASVRLCWPSCALGENPETTRLIAGTPLPPPPTVSSLNPTSGPPNGGTTVVIHGTNLGTASEVKFGSAQASSWVVVSATEITAESPAATAGTVDVTVTTRGGTSQANAGDHFEYIAPPTVTKLKPASGSAAGADAVTITGTNFTGATAVKFGETPAKSYEVVSATSIVAISPAHLEGTVDVTVTAVGGTSPLVAADHFKFEPSVTSISPKGGSISGGTSVTVEGEGFLEGGTGTKFKFGTTSATVVNCASTTECTVVSPAHVAGTVDVKAVVNGISSLKTTADEYAYG